MLGISVSFIFVPLLSEIIAAVQEKENLGENPNLNDKASGIFNTAYAIGCIIAPILGGTFTDNWGFRRCCDIMAFSSVTFAGLYFLLNILPGFFEKKPENNRVSDSLKSISHISEEVYEKDSLGKPMLQSFEETTNLSGRDGQSIVGMGNKKTMANSDMWNDSLKQSFEPTDSLDMSWTKK
jgi:MFS family permease